LYTLPGWVAGCAVLPESFPPFLELPPPEVQQLLFAAHRSQDAMDQFVSVVAGSLSPAEFFAPDNIGRIMSAVAPA